ncbi:hypothetical protein JCM8202_004801 [Rhodotorula sphaerocarpa]
MASAMSPDEPMATRRSVQRAASPFAVNRRRSPTSTVEPAAPARATEHSAAADTQGTAERSAPLGYFASSSPSRALSRFWDRLSPPHLPSPFHAAAAPPYPPAFLANSARESDAHDANAAQGSRGSLPDSIPIARPRPTGDPSPSAWTEQHDAASQLSFSLRRAAAQEGEAAAAEEGPASLPAHPWTGTGGASPLSGSPRSAGSRTSSNGGACGGWRSRRHRTESWEPPFRLPTMPWRSSKERQDAGARSGYLNDQLLDDDYMVDDEACFVDGWEGKVDFLVSLPSEISLNILSLLDFRSVLAAGAVSRQWRSLTLDPLLWRDLFHQDPRWHIKPEAYRLAAEAAQAAAQKSDAKGYPFHTPALTPSATLTPGSSSNFFTERPVMPNLKRAASSFGRAGAKRLVTGADRVSHGGVVIGRKLSDIVGDLNVLSLVPGASGNGSRGSSRAASEAGDLTAAATEEGITAGGRAGTSASGIAGRRSNELRSAESSTPSTPTRPPLLTRLSAGAGTPSLTLSSVALPSTSTLQTNAFASPPSASVPRSHSSSALSTLSSAFPMAATPSRPTNRQPNAPATAPPVTAAGPPSTPAQLAAASEAQDRRNGSEHLDWPKLFRDHWLLDQRWAQGKPSWSWFEGHEDSVYCCQFDERKIISGSRDRTIRVWDIASGETTHILRGHEGSVLCLQYDHEILVSGSSDSTVIVWDLVGDPATGFGRYEDKLKLVGHGMGVLDLCFDDRYIVSCSKDTKTHVWERATGKLYRVLQGHRGPVNAVQINGDRVLTASGDAIMKLWDLHTGQALRTFTGHTRGLACVSWAPSGQHFVSSSNDKTIKLWNATTGECIRTFSGHSDLVRGLAYDEKSRRIVSAGYDRTTRAWDADTGELVHKYNSHSSLVFDVTFSASKIVSSSHDRRILLMDFGVGLDVDKFL